MRTTEVGLLLVSDREDECHFSTDVNRSESKYSL